MSDPTPVRAGEDAGREATDLLKARIACLIRERDAAAAGSREMNRLRTLAEAEVARLKELVEAYEEAMADKRRLARMIDVAMHGEEGAAQQPSLCDLVGPASALRERVARLEEENARLRENDAMAFVKGIAGSTNLPEDIRTAASRLVAPASQLRAALTEGDPTDAQ